MRKNKMAAVLLLMLCLFYVSGSTVYGASLPPEKVGLSGEELQYMQSKKVLKVAILPNWKPFFYTGSRGEYEGLPVMILNRLAEETGVSLVFVPTKTYHESLELLKTGEVDLVGTLTEYSGRSAAMLQDSTLKMVPYLQTQAVLIQHKNTNLAKIPVVTLADLVGRQEVTRNQNVATIYYESPQECLNAVRCKQVELSICDSFTGAAWMQRYEAKDMLSIPVNMTMELGFGVLPEADSRLTGSLQKTIANFSNGDMTRSLIAGSDYGSDNLMEFIYRYPFEIVCFMASIMFVAALGLITYTKVNVSQHQALQGYEESYRLLSDTFGEAGVEYDYLNDTLTIFGEHSNLDTSPRVEGFKEMLQNRTVRVALTAEEFERIILNGAENRSFSTEFQCGVKSGEWVWYRLIYTVICTTESHRRPIRLVGCLTNVNAEHAEKERLLQLSSNDQLTGLLNRKTAQERIRVLMEEDPTHTGILAILDIDYFKKFNDQRGHLCGDDVLRSLGQTVLEIFDPEDVLCRWGGDEFLFFLVDDQKNEGLVAMKMEQLRQRMSSYQYMDEHCPVTLSIGGAKNFGCTFDVLFQQADDALYLAKENGKDQFWLCAPTQQNPVKPIERETR
ncbi:MAG: GGDEF domain-containing protein [Hungatella sp.]